MYLDKKRSQCYCELATKSVLMCAFVFGAFGGNRELLSFFPERAEKEIQIVAARTDGGLADQAQREKLLDGFYDGIAAQRQQSRQPAQRGKCFAILAAMF